MEPSNRCYVNNASGPKHAVTMAASYILTEKAKAECYEGNTLLPSTLGVVL